MAPAWSPVKGISGQREGGWIKESPPDCAFTRAHNSGIDGLARPRFLKNGDAD